MPPTMTGGGGGGGVPLPRRERKLRRSSIEKVIFAVLIVVVAWRGIAVSGVMTMSSSSSSSFSSSSSSAVANNNNNNNNEGVGRWNDDDGARVGEGDNNEGGFVGTIKKNDVYDAYDDGGKEEEEEEDSSRSRSRSSANTRRSESGSRSTSTSNEGYAGERRRSPGGASSRSSGSSGSTKRPSGSGGSTSRTQKMENDIFEMLRDDSQPLVTHKRLFIVNKPINPDDPTDSRTKPVLQHWLESITSDTNETLIYHFPRSLFEQLPLDEPKFEFKTCAVVGNSGVTLLKEYGEEIDNHDAVVRINMAPIRGFEKYVGKRTTFDVVNSHNVREILQGVRRWRPANEGETKLVLFETASHFARYHLCQPLLKKYGAENAILLNPLFSNRAHSLWIKLKDLLEKTKKSQYNRKPMSGFFAVLYALQMCETVDLYGFDAYTSRKKSYRYHYFDNVQGFTDVHSFDLAIEVFKFIAKKGTKGGLTINV